MFKKILCLLLVAAVLFSLAACGKKIKVKSEDELYELIGDMESDEIEELLESIDEDDESDSKKENKQNEEKEPEKEPEEEKPQLVKNLWYIIDDDEITMRIRGTEKEGYDNCFENRIGQQIGAASTVKTISRRTHIFRKM